MKRIVLVIATFVFVLTGCASVETNEKTASIPTGTTISIDNPQVSATQGECEAISLRRWIMKFNRASITDRFHLDVCR